MKKFKRIGSMYLSLMVLGFCIQGCDTGVGANPNQIIFPESDVSWRYDVQPLFAATCAVSGCHDQYTMAGNLSLEEYTHLFQRPGIVLPGDSAHSVLVQVVRGVLPHTYPIEAVITPNQRHGIAVWVAEGAANN